MTIRDQFTALSPGQPIEFTRANDAYVTALYRGLTVDGHVRYTVGGGENRYVSLNDVVELTPLGG